MSYAQDTSVSVEKSRAEIESTLGRYGATRFMYATDERKAAIAFAFKNKTVRFVLPIPSRDEKRFKVSPSGRRVYDDAQSYKNWEQGCRSRWRALYLCIKAKLEAVECGITTFEQEFLAHFVLPNGQVFGDVAIPQIEEASKNNQMPMLTFGGLE